MNNDLWITLAALAIAVGVLIVGILIGIGIGRDDEAARNLEDGRRRDRLYPNGFPRVLR